MPVFTRQYIFEKKNQIGEILIERILEFELSDPGPLAVHALLQLVIFMAKQNLHEIPSNALFYYLLLKYCRRQCNFTSPTWAKSLTKFSPKMQDFKHDLDCT